MFAFLKRKGMRSRVKQPQEAEVYQPVTICVGSDVHPYQISDFFCFRGVLFCRGLTEHSPGDIPRISIQLTDTEWRTVTYTEDPHVRTLPNRTSFAFSVALPENVGPRALQQSRLYIHFRCEHLNIADPSYERLRNDRFLSSECTFWDLVNSKKTGNVLEIGSRARSGIVRRSLFPQSWNYIGLDIVAGENVDVVGDAHNLGSILPRGHFDAVFSVSVWEHLAMPWKVSIELNKIMKIGGVAMINSHQSWPAHEEPWDYFRFSEYAWNTLFNEATGFTILKSGMGIPAVMAAATTGDSTPSDGIDWHYGYLASRCVVQKIAETTLEWPVSTTQITSTTYGY